MQPHIEATGDPATVLASLRGRPVVVLFWSSNHPLSRLMMSGVDAAIHGSDTAAIGVALNSSASTIEATCVQFGITWPQYLASAGDVLWSQHLKTSPSTAQLVLIDRDGSVVHRGRVDSEAWTTLAELAGRRPPLPQRELHGHLEWAGRPFASPEAGTPRFWFRNETKMVEAKLQVHYEAATSAFSLTGVEAGVYGISVYIGFVTKDPENAYQAWLTFGVPIAADVPEIVVPLVRAIRLVKPVDSAVDAERTGLMIHQSPVSIDWEPLVEADRYMVRIQRLALAAEATTSSETVLQQSVTTTQLSVELDEGWIYTLLVDAYREQELIGRIWGSGEPWAGSSYRFQVGTPQLEDSRSPTSF